MIQAPAIGRSRLSGPRRSDPAPKMFTAFPPCPLRRSVRTSREGSALRMHCHGPRLMACVLALTSGAGKGRQGTPSDSNGMARDTTEHQRISNGSE
jgi:hypothetical protein